MVEHTSFETNQPDSTTYQLNEDKITVSISQDCIEN